MDAMRHYQYIELLPISPNTPVNSRVLKLGLARLFSEKAHVKPKERVISCGYPFIVSKIKKASRSGAAAGSEIVFIASFKGSNNSAFKW